MIEPSDDMKLLVGKEAEYENNKGIMVMCLINGIEAVHSVMTTEDGRYGGVRFRLKPIDGSRAFWTPTMPDHGRPIT